jgi:predicted lipoprotein with Yx(FWY)xxD motif
MLRFRALILSPLVLVVLLAAGCGSSSSGGSSPSSASTPAASGTSSSTSSGGYGYARSTGSSTSTPGHEVVVTTKHSKLGTVLAAGPKHLTVYLFEADKGPHSRCSGACAAAWPPVIGTPKAAGQVSAAKLGSITRPDGTKQVTYKGHPLYFFVKDKDDGDSYGEAIKAFGAEWYVLSPAGTKIDNS